MKKLKKFYKTTGKILEPISINNYLETHPFHIGMLFPVGLSMTGLLVISIIV